MRICCGLNITAGHWRRLKYGLCSFGWIEIWHWLIYFIFDHSFIHCILDITTILILTLKLCTFNLFVFHSMSASVSARKLHHTKITRIVKMALKWHALYLFCSGKVINWWGKYSQKLLFSDLQTYMELKIGISSSIFTIVSIIKAFHSNVCLGTTTFLFDRVWPFSYKMVLIFCDLVRLT